MDKKDDICKKETGQLASANPTHATLDAVEHEQDLEAQRLKRKDSAVEIANPANDARKSASDNGDKTEQDISSEYPMVEGKRRIPKGSNNSGIEPSPLNQ